jgi:hypothetical protein
MRVKLFGLRRGSADLFVLGAKTYALAAEGSTIKACRELGDAGWRPLPQDWLTSQSQCAGSGALGATAVDWWKTPIEPAPASYWVWHKTSDQSPFRLVFPFASDRLAPLSRYAMSYQVGFEPLPETDLRGVVELCKRAKPAPARDGVRALRRLIEAMPRASHRADADIRRLMPALDACPATPLPEWPEKLAITGLMTPIDSDENPYPAEVLYDWTLRAQRSRIFFPSESAIAIQDSLLLDPRGHTVTRHRARRADLRARAARGDPAGLGFARAVHVRSDDQGYDAADASRNDPDPGVPVGEPPRRLGLACARRATDGFHGHLAARRRREGAFRRAGLPRLASRPLFPKLGLGQAAAMQTSPAMAASHAARLEPVLDLPSRPRGFTQIAPARGTPIGRHALEGKPKGCLAWRRR